jgi:hypothetical protein
MKRKNINEFDDMKGEKNSKLNIQKRNKNLKIKEN